MEKLQKLLSEYGPIALGTYFCLFLLTLAAFATAISLGVKVDGPTSGSGVLLGAYLATQLTKPLRIAGTLAATPVVAGVLRKLRRQPAEPPAAAPPAANPAAEPSAADPPAANQSAE